MKKEDDIMKTIKVIKITAIIQSIYCFCCITFSSFLLLKENFNSSKFFTIIYLIVAFVWLFGVVGVIIPCYAFCFESFSYERKIPEARKIIGKKYIWIFVLPVISFVFFMLCLAVVVEVTGGV